MQLLYAILLDANYITFCTLLKINHCNHFNLNEKGRVW